MFHIVFNADENYIKYCAVLMTSIIKNTDTSKKFKDFFDEEALNSAMGGGHCTDKENSNITYKLLNYENLSEEEKTEGYIFHILTDFISNSTRKKLNELQDELSKIYPCKICIYFMNNEKFKDCARVHAAKHTSATYYKMAISSTLSNDIKTCLYLDIDMLVIADLREFFHIDLKDNAIASVLDYKGSNHNVLTAKNQNLADMPLNTNESYFNTGMMLLNLAFWRTNQLEKKCFYLCKNYIPRWAEQCIINKAAQDKNIKLPLKFNFFDSNFLELETLDDNKYNNRILYTKSEYENSMKSIKVVHFISYKPWNTIFDSQWDLNLMQEIISLEQSWWNTALTTPIFKDELLGLKFTLKDKEFQNYVNRITQLFIQKQGEIKELQIQISNLNQTITKLENENKTLQNEIISLKQTKGAALRVQNQLAYKLGTTLMSYSKSKFFYLNPKFYLTLLSIKSKHKKSKKAYENLIFSNPSFKLPLLETYADYDEALKVQNFFSYRLGLEFIKASKTWYKGGLVKFYFKAKKLKKEFKKKKV
ncbi:hypothetical protein GW575_00620 [Campylobacter sp. MIT 19-121]|uniref:glycosyltransferase family 8 protein n=1 Tax=Campylobacter sp. MIT 19-121 TaxID=2703906 RepID=UPI001389D0A4|nr:glycosyltransferase family 8 protein [Campylobacter sp. MIT 19-121]NDJ26462.1 hypothetical protein [Campylobacter sp. MIT 19-121]